MKKLMSFILAVTLFFTFLPISTQAVETESESMQEIIMVEQKINDILAELNEMAAEEKMAEILAKEDKELEERFTEIKVQNNQRKQYLEECLDVLGVNTIDPNNTDDMAVLAEIMFGNSDSSVMSISEPPDLYSIADLYTLQQCTTDITFGGVTYDYTYIFCY